MELDNSGDISTDVIKHAVQTEKATQLSLSQRILKLHI